MDQPAMINGGAFQSASAAPYNLTEIWPFRINGGDSGGASDLMKVRFGQTLDQFKIASVNLEVSGNDPMVLDHRLARSGGSRKRRDESPPENESAKLVSRSIGNDIITNECDGKRIKTEGSRDENFDYKAEAEANSSKPTEQNAKTPEPPKQDYIHVRARRGQATDSHSLAERARREKISERMKILQDLVPGCNKVIGKALVLDEIINYIQSLQHQVEFLSMKLEAVNSKVNPGIEGFPSKDVSFNSPFRTSLFNKHSTQMEWRLVHKLQGTMVRIHRQNGYICRLVVASKEQHNLDNLHQLLIRALGGHN